jgi:hypothetical protein
MKNPVFIEMFNMLKIESSHFLTKAYDSGMMEVLYIVLMEFVVPMKLVMPIKMYLNEIYSEVSIGTHLSGNFPTQNGFKQGDTLSPVFSILL